ncbi:MAG: Hsp70 family protein, partial [Blastocatellia bacterium]
AYGIENQANQFLMVYDLGGGTFDVSIIEQMGDILEVRASHGNVNLGGDDFDERLLQHLLSVLSSDHRYDFKSDRRAMARLSRAAESAKIGLSHAPYARAAEEFLARYDGQIAHLDSEVGREEFEMMIDDLLHSTLDSINRALKDGNLKAEQINRVLLVGGSTRIPRVAEMIEEHIGLQPSMEINPDEAVALGAGAQAAIINGEPVEAMLIDVSPHSLGIAIAEFMFNGVVPGVFRPIIRRNTTIPTTKSERFFTMSPQQDKVEIEVYQGESPVAAENTHLGSFLLTDIPPAPDPDSAREVIVEFSYNLNGIVEVTARDHKGERREVMSVNSNASQRAASEPEVKKHFNPKTERDVADSLAAAARRELQLEADGRAKDVKKLRDARHKLEQAHQGVDEKQLLTALNKLDDLLYELE